ncbi:uncharacterized protein LOC111913921 [Lactuca sativa]|uniref:uncharacterized protein LOC111913921 n=1 Tax=Lactuca sativa TaxID=4236 RepID=UPI000CD9C47B|nr:uncharacterized protein LOC111913921 [Lactuca sativa]
MNAKPTSFDGTRGVIALTQWFEKIESIFKICSCSEANKVRFAARTFIDKVLTWWNGRFKSLTLPLENAMAWETLKELMLAEYCPRGELPKLEHKLWNLKMKGSDIAAYTSRFEDLALLSPGMVTPESKKIEMFIWGLMPPTQGNVLSAKPNMFDSAKCLPQTLIDHGVDLDATTATLEPVKERGDGKKKFWNNRNGQSSQGSSKKQQTVAVHAVSTRVAAPATQAPTSMYAGNLPRCDKCNHHHLTSSPCREILYNNCGKKGHTARNCRTPDQPTNQASGRDASQACYGCSEVGHYKRNRPKAAITGNTGRVLAMGQEEAVVDPTVVMGTFLLDNSYECILFDSGVERSFVSHSFKHLLNHEPQSLTKIFTVEMANGEKALMTYSAATPLS